MSKNINPVFLALARPPMCYGVTQSYLIAIFGFNMALAEFVVILKQIILRCYLRKYSF